MVVQRDIDKIEFNGREWTLKNPVSKIKSNIAIDSETVDGKPFLMASSNLKGTNHLFSDNVDDYLNFLLEKRFIQSNNWWYNMQYDIGGIIKMLPRDNVFELIKNGSTKYNNFKLNYLIGKMFKISHLNGNGSIHYDLAQFYNKIPLKVLAEKTSYKKVDVDDIAAIDLKKVNNDPEYRKLILDRCEIDARITKELADQFTDKVNLVVKNNRYLSVASIARAYFLTNLSKRLKLPSKRIMDYGLKTFHGGLVEVLKLGTFKNAFNIDIGSAYPSVMANLYSCHGIWTTRPEYVPDTAYSFYKVVVDYHDDDISPLWFNHKNKDYHPNGLMETYLTQFEYEFLIKKGFNIKILAASHLKKSKDHDQPFKQLINDLYDKRMIAKENNEEIQQIYKLILNSAYGCTINDVEKKITCSFLEWQDDGSNAWHIYDINDETVFYTIHNLSTSMYNPIFASYITSGCRMALIDKVWKYRDKLLSLNTDGAYLFSKIPVQTSKELGKWTSKNISSLKVMGNGRYFVYNPKGDLNIHESAFRGLRSAKKNMPIIDEQMKNNPNFLGTHIKYERPMKVKECVKSGNIEDINIWTPKTTNISFRIDRRAWHDQITCNEDLLTKEITSTPFNINQIGAMA